MSTGTIGQIYRYPVKSMEGEVLEQVDRAFGLYVPPGGRRTNPAENRP